jgi:hypothetical protein
MPYLDVLTYKQGYLEGCPRGPNGGLHVLLDYHSTYPSEYIQ